MGGEDAELVALVDNELDPEARSRLLARLADDATLRKRHEMLLETGAQIAAAFEGLLRVAPLDQLRTAIPKADVSTIVPRLLSGTLHALAAGMAIGFLAAGIATWTVPRFLLRVEDGEDWRTAVVEYMELYTNETFAFDDSSLSSQEKKLKAIGEKLNLRLAPETLTISGLRFKSAQLLSYDGAPLAEIVYLNAQGAPVLFCVVGGAREDAKALSERRGDLSLTWWTNGGRSYLVIGRLPEQQIANLAGIFEKRFAKT
jgi:anti-sigma factor RsiW